MKLRALLTLAREAVAARLPRFGRPVTPVTPAPESVRPTVRKPRRKRTSPVRHSVDRYLKIDAGTLQDWLDAVDLADLLTEDQREAKRIELRAAIARRQAAEAKCSELCADGVPWVDAYAECFGLDRDRLVREAVDHHVGRVPGETRTGALKRAHLAEVERRYFDAEEFCRGHMVNHRGRDRNVNPMALFYGPAHVANAYASDELKEWWDNNGGRLTFADYCAEVQTAALG